MFRTLAHLPAGRHFALTWGIPDQPGGMTGAMLRRSRAFRKIGGVDVDILTLDDRPDYRELSDRLRQSGAVADGIRIRNLWDELRERTPAARGQVPEVPQPLQPEDTDQVESWEGVVLSRARHGDDGTIVAVDRFRRDGTLLATERVGADRRHIVYAPDGTPVRSWRTSGGMHRWWYDRAIGRSPAFLLVDSKTAARSVAGYQRDNVTTVHIVHASHRLGGRAGVLRASRETVLRRAADFDAVVVLTPRQRADLESDLAGFGVEGRIRSIPNAVDLSLSPAATRKRGSGVAIASLNRRKRLEHAVDAVAAAHEADPRVRLDIVGEGPQEAQLRRRIERRDAADVIRLQGYDPDARARFGSADFSLLTSTSEGLPLVLAESMAAGCIPIAYDIFYGPADIIRDGVDGFVVPEGDVDAVTRRIVELQSMPTSRVEALRRRARRRAAEYSDEAVTRQWSRELHAAYDAKLLAAAREQPLSVRLRRRAGVVRRWIRRMLGR